MILIGVFKCSSQQRALLYRSFSVSWTIFLQKLPHLTICFFWCLEEITRSWIPPWGLFSVKKIFPWGLLLSHHHVLSTSGIYRSWGIFNFLNNKYVPQTQSNIPYPTIVLYLICLLLPTTQECQERMKELLVVKYAVQLRPSSIDPLINKFQVLQGDAILGIYDPKCKGYQFIW